MFGSGSGIGCTAIENPLWLIREDPKKEHFASKEEEVGAIMPIAFGYLVAATSIRCIQGMIWDFVCVDRLRK